MRIPKFYAAEYLLTLVTSLVVLVSGSALASMIIHRWMVGGTGLFADFTVLYLLAALIIALPIHLVLYMRMRHNGADGQSLFSLRVAGILLALYLLVTMAVVVGLAIWLLTLWFDAYLGTGNGADKQLWAATFSLLFAIATFKYSAWHFFRSRSLPTWQWLYAVVVGVVSIAVIVLGFIYPAQAYRNAAQDFVKEADLAHIQNEVGNYVNQNNALPENLSVVSGLSGEIRNPVSAYRYKTHGGTNFGIFGYEICATFATEKDGFGFAAHKSGEQCFARFAISPTGLERDLLNTVQNVENGAAKLSQSIANFVGGVETNLGQQIGGLESYLESAESGTDQLRQEMQRLDTHLTGLTGNTAELDQDFEAVGQFIDGLLCALDPNCTPN
jgi:hypothetical protein